PDRPSGHRGVAPGQGARVPLRRARAALAPVRAQQRPAHHRPDGPHMDAPVPLILAALLAAGALVARAPRARAAAMLGALVLAPRTLASHIADSDRVKPLRDHPSLAVAGAVGAVVVLAVLALLFDRRP